MLIYFEAIKRKKYVAEFKCIVALQVFLTNALVQTEDSLNPDKEKISISSLTKKLLFQKTNHHNKAIIHLASCCISSANLSQNFLIYALMIYLLNRLASVCIFCSSFLSALNGNCNCFYWFSYWGVEKMTRMQLQESNGMK